MATTTVMEYERVVRFVDGRLTDVLGPGRHEYRARRTVLHRVDLRPKLLTVPGQEVLSSDGVAVRISVLVRVAVVDPVLAVSAAQDPNAEVYAQLQQALRAAVAERTVETLLDARATLGEVLAAAVSTPAAAVGLAVRDVAVRDVMLPGELRKAYGDVLLARQRGLAELERVRAEGAALRALANSARLLDEHPALLRLRTLQAAEVAGAKLVIKQL